MHPAANTGQEQTRILAQMRHATPLLLGPVVGLLLNTLPAQTIWTLPAGADLQPYIAQAAPGDVLVLNQGHSAFDLDKGLVLLGTGQTGITGDPYFGPLHCTFDIPNGQHAHCIGLSFDRIIQSTTAIGHSVLVQGGNVTFDSCRFQNSGGSYALRVDAGDTILQDCRVLSYADTWSGPPGVGLWVAGGTVSAHGCEIVGANGHFDTFSAIGYEGRPGLRVTAGTMVGSALQIVGGRTATDGSGSGVVPQPAVEQTGGTLRLVDSVATGGSGNHPPEQVQRAGAPAIVSTGGTCLVARTSIVPGDGTPPGGPSTGVVPDPAMIGMTRSGAPTLGQSFDGIATGGSSQQLLAIAGGFGAASITAAPLVEPLWLDPANAILLTLAVPAPGATVATTVAVPNTQSLLGNAVWLQALQLDGSNWRASSVVGGIMR